MACIARERLVELEKANSPVEEQIQQAGLFAGVLLSRLNTSHASNGATDATDCPGNGGVYGRQDYVLRWLLKKLQEKEMRRCPNAWRLLSWLVRSIPVRNVARILNERKFVIILRQAVEEAVGRNTAPENGMMSMEQAGESSDVTGGRSTGEKGKNSGSRKRKRTGVTLDEVGAGKVMTELRSAIFEAVDSVVHLSSPEDVSTESFTSEYMNSVIRTTSEEAARILGCWLELCRSVEGTSAIESHDSLLCPFIEIWTSRVVETDSAAIFSKHCLRQSLVLLSIADQLPEWKSQLEQLLARNIIVPAKAAYGSSAKTDLLEILAGSCVYQHPFFAPTLFDIAIRCLQHHNSRRRRLQDTAWLQAVFSTLKNALPSELPETGALAVTQMLQSSIEHQLVLELPLLQSVTVQHGFTTGETGWSILATITKLDSNVFLIPSPAEDLLKELLFRVTKANTEVVWPTVVDQVVDDILVPLVGEFARARQLTAFIHHWYEQLKVFENLRQSTSKDIRHFSAWEDEALQLQLKDFMEASLTTWQIVEILDWLEEKAAECQAAVNVLADAISGAITREETMAAVGLRLLNVVINDPKSHNLDERYRSRRWRLITHSFQWSFSQDDKLDSYRRDHLYTSPDLPYVTNPNSLEGLESFRCFCAWWSREGVKGSNAGLVLVLYKEINALLAHISKVVKQTAHGLVLEDQKWGSRVINTERDVGWLTCAYAHCVLIEYPEVLELLTDSANSNAQELRKIVWIASATTPFSSAHSPSPWLQINHDVFPRMWRQMLQEGYVLDNPKVSSQVINAMLDCRSHIDDPIEKAPACNKFVVNCLHQLPLEVFSKSNRELILTDWPLVSPDPSHNDTAALSYRMATLDPAVLSLKARMMQRPTLYDGIQFQDLVDLAGCMVTLCRNPKEVLPVFALLARLTLGHVFATLDQPKSRQYIQGMIVTLEEWLQTNCKAKFTPSYAMIRLMQITILVLTAKAIRLGALGILKKKKLDELRDLYRDLLLSNLRRRLQKHQKVRRDDDEWCMSLYSTIDALDEISITKSDLADLQTDAKSGIASLKEVNTKLGERIETFMIEHDWRAFDGSPISFLCGDTSSVNGRVTIKKKALAMTDTMAEPERLHLAHSLLEGLADEQSLDKFLALWHVIVSCTDRKDVTTEGTNQIIPSLSSVYSKLAAKLQKPNGTRQFCLVSKIMEIMLRTKPRAITQYNIDTTIASITILCTRHAPSSLRASRGRTIYSHLVHLVQAILTSHRLKLQGHFHLLIQTLQALLRCLFVPLSANVNRNINNNKSNSSPTGYASQTWLSGRDPKHYLTPVHAASYARLLTLLCDPTISSLTPPSQQSQPSLHSPTQSAKHHVSQHIPIILTTYISLQLNISADPASRERLTAIREKLVPGIYAIFDIMTVEQRRVLGESLDASGRAVLGGLVRDWVRWGKWKG